MENHQTQQCQAKRNTDIGIMSMVPAEMIKWCKERKALLGISNQKLAELSGVPLGTVDRILSGSYSEFRYSSIQPIVAVLIGINESTPAPEEIQKEIISDEGQYYYDTIEGYRLIVSEKNREIEQLISRYEAAAREIKFLQEEIAKKQSNLEAQLENCRWLQSLVDELRKGK